MVIDAGDPGYADTGWKVGGLDGGHDDDYRSADPGNGSEEASWTFTGIAAGTYEVYATWVPYGNRPDDAAYRVKTGDPEGSTPYSTTHVNQQVAPAGRIIGGTAYTLIATVTVPDDGYAKVKLASAAEGYAIADAVALVPTSTPAVRISAVVPVPPSIPIPWLPEADLAARKKK
jgi:hypothetical protein